MKSLILSVLSILLLFAIATTQDYNWSGYGDTSNVPACSSTVTVYSKAFLQMPFQDALLITKVDDTSAAGFKNDSVSLKYGWEQFSMSYNKAGKLDTCFKPPVFIDSVKAAKFGNITTVLCDSMGVPHPYNYNGADTIHDSGWATRTNNIYPQAEQYIRFWATGLAANKKACPIRLQFSLQRKVYTTIRSR
jgi:hypothetical protein